MGQHKFKKRFVKSKGIVEKAGSVKAHGVGKAGSDPLQRVQLVGDITVSVKERSYIKKFSKNTTDEEPTLVIDWRMDILDATIMAAAGNQIPPPPGGALPNMPPYLNITSTG